MKLKKTNQEQFDAWEEEILSLLDSDNFVLNSTSDNSFISTKNFVSKYPDVAKEWHPTKNGDLRPYDLKYGSSAKVWWKCPVGHEYQATIRDRGPGGTKCPICRRRKTTSFPEQAIFYYVKKVFSDALNRYGECFENSMEFDVFIPSLNTAIEYDGAAWHKSEEQYEREVKKWKFCQDHQIRLIRIKELNNLNWNDTADKTFQIPKFKRHNPQHLESIIEKLFEYLNVANRPVIDIEKDRNGILSYVCKIENSLAEIRPDVAAKWNHRKNQTLKPEMFSVSSNEKVWWFCSECGHEWESSINSMTREGRYGCPICARAVSGQTFIKGVVSKVGSLAETMPDLVKQWHPTKNGSLTPSDVTAGRFQPVWWLCDKCGYEWQSSPNNRKKGVGCPCCSGRVARRGVNDIETTHPHIAKEWHPTKNSNLHPYEFKAGSGYKAWWICPTCGNEYQATLRHRTSTVKPTGCPICGHKRGAKKLAMSVMMLNPETSQVIKTFNSIAEVCREFKVGHKTIKAACQENKLVCGYQWRYSDTKS